MFPRNPHALHGAGRVPGGYEDGPPLARRAVFVWYPGEDSNLHGDYPH